MTTDERDVPGNIAVAAPRMLGDRIVRVMYLLPTDELIDALTKEEIHLVREVRLDLDCGGTMYFNWVEESSLNGHPFRLEIASSTGYDPTADLKWIDMAHDQRWKRIRGEQISTVRLFSEEASYENDVTPSRVVTGIEFRTDVSYVQLSVIQPPRDYKTRSLLDLEWMPSSIVSIVFEPFDLARRSDVRVRSMDL